MKKVMLLTLALLLACSLFCFVGCEPKSNLNVEYLPDTTVRPSEGGDSDAIVKIIQYTWDGWGTSYKTITGAAADRMIRLLEALPSTGETQSAISSFADFPEPGTACDLPAERGTKWVEADGKIYRLDPNSSEIVLVKKHLGKGTILGNVEECCREIENAWNYWPSDCWNGTYKDGKLTMGHRYAADTTVTIKVKSMSIVNDHHPENSMTVELISSIDQTVTIQLNCQASSDNLARGDKKTVALVAGEPETVELTFGGFHGFTYDVNLTVGNTRMTIVVDPR